MYKFTHVYIDSNDQKATKVREHIINWAVAIPEIEKHLQYDEPLNWSAFCSNREAAAQAQPPPPPLVKRTLNNI